MKISEEITKRDLKDYVKGICLGGGLYCRNCKHWKQETDNTGECSHLGFACESSFCCGDWSEKLC